MGVAVEVGVGVAGTLAAGVEVARGAVGDAVGVIAVVQPVATTRLVTSAISVTRGLREPVARVASGVPLRVEPIR